MEEDGNPRLGAARLYAEAHALHYSVHDIHGALQAYDGIIAAHPGAVEAGYSRTQIQNIVHQLVPAPELLAALVQLAHRHVQPDVAAQPDLAAQP